MSHLHDPDCIFCQIIAGESPAAIVYEDDQLITFLDLFPATEGHSLIVPKPHYPDIFPMSQEHLQAVVLFSQRLAHAQMKAFDAHGIAIAQFNRAAAGQTVFHYHMHVIPRITGKSMRFHGREKADMDELRQIAARIANALEPL